MAGNERFDDSIGAWLEETAPNRLPQRVLAATFERTRRTRQDPAWRAVLGILQMPRFFPALGGATVVVLATVVALTVIPAFGPGGQPTPAASPTAAASPHLPRCRDSGTGTVLGCSRDGTSRLVQRTRENLFILHADGSETQVTEQLSGFSDIPGSARPSGATISPDGSRVVFAGLTEPYKEGQSCHHGALFAVDADGGPAELLWESQAVREGGIVREPTFSPDGTQIAFADGYCDHLHSVWVMDADGTDARKIVSMEAAGWVRGLAWSPAGDRIALNFASPESGGVYTFAPDGSGLTLGTGGSAFCWPGLRC
jgi:Tol biopolymer transport system component